MHEISLSLLIKEFAYNKTNENYLYRLNYVYQINQIS